jgi:hypothetical protein
VELGSDPDEGFEPGPRPPLPGVPFR